MKFRRLRPLVAAAVAAVSLGAVSAQAEGLYVGASLGSPHYPDSVNGIAGSGSGLSGKVFGGYQLTPNFALEVGAADLGHIDNSNGRVDGRSVFLDAIGIAPLTDKWSLLGRLGVAHVNLDTSAGDGSGSGLNVGLGAQYALTSSIGLRGEWERYRPSVFGDKPNVDQVSFGVRVGF
jgi:OmpA-OmpF porin, OOP family